MKEIMDSFTTWIKERSTGPFYAILFTSYVAWNWKFFFSLFFEKEQFLRGETNLEYAVRHAFHSPEIVLFPPLFDLLNTSLEVIVTVVYHLFIPVVFAYFAIRWLPILHAWAHSLHHSYAFARKREYDRQNNEYQSEKTKNLERLKKRTADQTKVIQEIAMESERQKNIIENLPEGLDYKSTLWTEEYQKFKKSNVFDLFGDFYQAIYKHSGNVSMMNSYSNISAKMFAYAHSAGLVEYTSSLNDTIALTEKGMYFVRQYLEDPDSEVQDPYDF